MILLCSECYYSDISYIVVSRGTKEIKYEYVFIYIKQSIGFTVFMICVFTSVYVRNRIIRIKNSGTLAKKLK